MSTTGPLLVLDHLVELVAAWSLLLLSASLGNRLLSFFRLDFRSGEQLLLAVPLGTGALGTALLVLGVAGGFGPLPLAVTMLGAVAVAVPGVGPTVKAGKEVLAAVWAESRAVVVVLAMVVAAMTIQASTPPTDWDSLIYHLQVPEVWLERGHIVLPEDNLHAAYVGLWQVLYVPLLAIGAWSAPALLNVSTAALLAIGLFAFGNRWFDAKTGRLAALALWGSPILILVAVTARVDVSLALFLLAGHHAAFQALYGDDQRDSWAVLAGLMIGLAVGVKLLAAPYLVALVPIGFLLVLRRRLDPVSGWLLAAGALLAASLPWLAQKWLLFGDPLYPLLSQRLLEPGLRPLFEGATHVPGDVSLAFSEAEWLIVDRPNLRNFFFSPRSLTQEGEGGLYLGNPLFLVLPLWLLRLREERLTLVTAAAAIYAALVVGPDLKTNLRYLIPTAALLTVTAGRLLAWAWERLRWKRAVTASIGILMSAALANAVRPFAFHWSRMPVFGHLTGTVSAQEYLVKNENPDVRLYGRMAEWLNRTLGPDDRVLLVFEGRGLYLEPSVIQDNLLANWPLISARLEKDDCLGRLDLSHVIVNYGVLNHYLDRGLRPERLAWNRFPRFAERCLRREKAMDGYVVYRLQENAEVSNGLLHDPG